MGTYHVYGLRLKSQWPLPYPEVAGPYHAEVELYEASAAFFSDASKNAPTEPDKPEWYYHARLRDGSDYLRWWGLFEFLVTSDGYRIACRPLTHASRESFLTYMLGPVLSFALLKRGIEPLHSTAVVIDGHAVGFVGNCGYGKSSLGASFLQRGHRLLTDDVLVVKEDSGFSAFPGPPRIKLFPKVARKFFGDQVAGTRMSHLTPKLIISLDRPQSCRTSVPLKAIYVLTPPAGASRRKSVTIRRLPQRKAFLELIRNTFNMAVTEPDRLKHQFLLCARMASTIPIKLLSYPRTMTVFPSVRQAILSDLAR